MGEIERQAGDRYAHGQLQSAIKILQAGVRQHPESAQLHFMLGNALMREHAWHAAIPEYQASAKLRPQFPDTYLNLGYAFYHSRMPSEAVDAWRTAARQSPRDSLPAVSLALGLRAAGQEREARECMLQTMYLDPEWKRRVTNDFRWSADMRREVDELAAAVSGNPGTVPQHS